MADTRQWAVVSFGPWARPKHLALMEQALHEAYHVAREEHAHGRDEEPNYHTHTEAATPAPAEPPATYQNLGSLYVHECRFRCDSQWAVNCNCNGKCALHSRPPASSPSEKKP